MNSDATRPVHELVATIELRGNAKLSIFFERWPGSAAPPGLRIERTSPSGKLSSFSVSARQRAAFLGAVADWSRACEGGSGQAAQARPEASSRNGQGGA